MTQVEFGEYFKIPVRTLQNWETGTCKCNDFILDLLRYKLVNEKIIEETEPEQCADAGNFIRSSCVQGMDKAAAEMHLEELKKIIARLG